MDDVDQVINSVDTPTQPVQNPANYQKKSTVIIVGVIIILTLIAVTAVGIYYLGARTKNTTFTDNNLQTKVSTPTVMVPLSSPTSIEQTRVKIDDELIERVRADGEVSVIVTLNTPYSPEAQLANDTEIKEQRAAIAADQDKLVTSITRGSVRNTSRMTLFPQITLRVDEVALEIIAASPLVQAIGENGLNAPTN